MIYTLDGYYDPKHQLITPEIAEKKPNLVTFITDMQTKFVESLAEHKDRTVMSNVKFLEFCVKEDIPIVLVESLGQGKLISELLDVAKHSKSAKVYLKRGTSAFDTDYLSNILQTYDVKRLFFTGVNATVCVLRSMVDARLRGFEVSTAYDVIANGYNCMHTNDEIKKYYGEAKMEYYNSYTDFIKTI